MSEPTEKEALRAQMRVITTCTPQDLVEEATVAIQDRLLEHLRSVDARVIMLWMPLHREIDLLPLGETLLGDGRRACVPRMNWDDSSMEPVAVTSFQEGFEVRRHNIREPMDTLSLPLDALDAVIVPGLAFDGSGNRLGRGGGFYDRFLVRLSPETETIGVCFSDQRIARVPTEPTDQPVGAVCCEREMTWV